MQKHKGPLQMSIQELSPETLAKLFFHYHEALAPDFGCASSLHPRAWSEVSQQEQGRMVAAARLALLEIESDERTGSEEEQDRYFARPGTAEWGC
jgi:hypothetical protein